MDTTTSEKLPIRFIDVQGNIYLSKEDLVQYLFDNAWKEDVEVLDVARNIHYYTAYGESD